ncbi:MAG TPA: hypothetical protein ENJ28_06120 [Gammaproteobacteria bacterium]|nr:hypothetical protein [Gammaproteobacteria bacterium]
MSAIRPELEFGRGTERDVLVAMAGWNILRYSNSDLDALEHYYSLDWGHTGERYKASIDTDFTIRTTLTSEIGESGVLAPINRNQWLVAPTWEYQLTPRQRIQLSYIFQNTTYQRKKNFNAFTDYTYHSISAAWFYQLNERLETSLSLFASRYEPDNLPQRSDTLGAQIGLQYIINETLTGGVSAGIRSTFSKATVPRSVTVNGRTFFIPGTKKTVHDNEVGFVATADLEKQLEHGRWSLSFNRQLQPLGFGGLSEQTQASFRYRHDFTKRWSFHLYLNGKILDSTGGSNRNIKRRYFSVKPYVRWQWTKEINLELSYNYRYQKFKRNDKAAEANVVSFLIRYQPLKEW